MTDTLDEGLRAWLSRKGIENLEDIRKIETVAGSLTWGLLMVLSALPRSKKRSAISGPSAPRKRQNEPFDLEAFRSIKKHITDLADRQRRERGEKFLALGDGSVSASSTSQSQDSAAPPKPPTTTLPGDSEPKGGLPKARNGDVSGCVDEVQDILETIRMDSKNQQSSEQKDMFPSHLDQFDFEPEHEAQLDFRQLASMAMDPELDSQNYQAHIVGGAPDMLKIEETLDLPMKNGDPSVPDPSHLDLSGKKTRERGPNIKPVEPKDLDGSIIRISKHQEVQIRYYPTEDSTKAKGLTWKSGPSLAPDGPEDIRTIHFTAEGIDIRNAAGETFYLQTRRPSNSKATFPRSIFEDYTIGDGLSVLWKQVRALKGSKDA